MKVLCRIVSIEWNNGRCRAWVERLSVHPILGEPKEGKLSVTSEIKRINFEEGYFVTQNTMYVWSGQ